jgi:hypothetical protein
MTSKETKLLSIVESEHSNLRPIKHKEEKKYLEETLSPRSKQVGTIQGGLKLKSDQTLAMGPLSPKGVISPRRKQRP